MKRAMAPRGLAALLFVAIASPVLAASTPADAVGAMPE
jgi:hypothetical protein